MNVDELMSTQDNIEKTLLNDEVARRWAVLNLIDTLNVTNMCSIAIDGQWGSGKTFFVKQTKLLLDFVNAQATGFKLHDNTFNDTFRMIVDEHQKQEKITWKPMFSVYYDAWSNDNDIDPLLSIIYSIALTICDDQVLKTTKIDFNQVGKLVTQIIGIMQGWNLNGIAKVFIDIANTATNVAATTDLLSEIKMQKKLKDSISEFLDAVTTKERGEKIIIFIDELDRCKPTFAVQLLERVKHYFDKERVVFVFSTNVDQLQHTVKKFYGDDFNATRYLNRFFDYIFELPVADMEKYLHITDGACGHNYNFICTKVMKLYNLSLRESGQYSRMTDLAFNVDYLLNPNGPYDIYEKRALDASCSIFLPIMFALKLTDTKAYNDFINGKGADECRRVLCSEDLRYIMYIIFGIDPKDEKADTKVSSYVDSVYSSVFIHTDNDEDTGGITIAHMTFSSAIKTELLKIISELSDKRNFATLK